jgi:hypothetical protein
MTQLPFTVDPEYIIAIRRELHQVPELAFDLPRTTAIVKRELVRIGIPYSEDYGRGSVVGILDGSGSGFTIGTAPTWTRCQSGTNELLDKSDATADACLRHDALPRMLLGTARRLLPSRTQ